MARLTAEMRILFFCHYFPPEANAPARRVSAHARRWAAAGHDVTVITCNPHHPTGVLYPSYRNLLRRQEAMVDGVRVVRVWTWLAANAGTWRRLANYLTYMVSATWAGLRERRPDVVIATSPQFFCGWAGVLVSNFRRLPFVLEVRDLWPASIAAVGAIRARWALRLVALLERWMYSAACQMVTVGEGYRSDLIDRGVAPERIAVVPHGVDRGIFRPTPADPELANRIGVGGRFVVAYCGTVGLAHGLEVVPKAAAELNARGERQIVFLVVGAGARLAALRQEVSRQRLDNVVCLGQVGSDAVPALLAVADVCLVHLRRTPAFRTAIPSKIFEAAAMGRPIILGVEGSAQRFVDELGCGLCIEPENARELADAVVELAADSELRTRLGQVGVSAMAKFDRDRLSTRYLRIIKSAVGEAKRG